MIETLDQSAEAQLSELITRFHREQQGHAPTCISSILSSMAVVRSFDIFTPTEKELAKTTGGKKLIQSARREQRALTRKDIEKRVSQLTDRSVARSFYDLDVRTGEQIEIYIFD